jgi:hypothetical protein
VQDYTGQAPDAATTRAYRAAWAGFAASCRDNCMAAHESPRTTKLYDRTSDQVSLEEVERIII